MLFIYYQIFKFLATFYIMSLKLDIINIFKIKEEVFIKKEINLLFYYYFDFLLYLETKL